MKLTKYLCWLLCAVLLLGLAACGRQPNSPAQAGKETVATEPGATVDPVTGDRPAVTPTPLAAIVPAETYGQVQALFCDYMEQRYRIGGYRYGFKDGGLVLGGVSGEVPLSPNAPTETDKGDTGIEDTGTNIQVPGVDEADVVKTDGSCLYVLDDETLTILRAAGAETGAVSVITPVDCGIPNHARPQALLVGAGRVALISTADEFGLDDDGAYFEDVVTYVSVFDVSDPASPVLLGSRGVDGYYSTARLLDGTVYLVSVRFLWAINEEDDPESCIPRVYNADGKGEPLAAGRVYLCPHPTSTAFTTVAAFSLEAGTLVDTMAFTDNTDAVYMDHEGLYLARRVMNDAESEPFKEDSYSVVEHVDTQQTEIKRIRFDGGSLRLDGTGLVDGYLINQFAMDCRDGYLRLATTMENRAYRLYTDEKHGWTNFEDLSSQRESGITVLDGELKQVGHLGGLGKDERIYAVRFAGDLGYVVTFRETDPVYTVDLSDPKNPTLQSELKLPGVSKYLHVFSEDRLFGFGQAVETEGLQLTMFDISDPKDVKVQAQTVLKDYDGAEAEYDHKALLVKPDRGLIGFSAWGDEGESYVLCDYQDGGFRRLGSFRVDYFPSDARGILLGDYMYLCSGSVCYVVSMADYTVIATISDAVG